MSIISFYLRVFPQKKFRYICFAVMGIVIASTLAVAFGQAFACTPISDGWKAVPTGSCVNREQLQLAGSIINLLTDVIVLVLPMKYFYGMPAPLLNLDAGPIADINFQKSNGVEQDQTIWHYGIVFYRIGVSTTSLETRRADTDSYFLVLALHRRTVSLQSPVSMHRMTKPVSFLRVLL